MLEMSSYLDQASTEKSQDIGEKQAHLTAECPLVLEFSFFFIEMYECHCHIVCIDYELTILIILIVQVWICCSR